MADKITIMKAEEKHFDVAGDIAIKAWTPIREEFKRLLSEEIYTPFFENWQVAKRNEIIRGLQNGNGFVAIIDGKVVGFVYYFADHGTKIGTIGGLAVDESAKGKGIGKILCAHALDEMRKEGLLHATVTTGGDNAHAPARRTYESVGFEKYLPSVKYYMNL